MAPRRKAVSEDQPLFPNLIKPGSIEASSESNKAPKPHGNTYSSSPIKQQTKSPNNLSSLAHTPLSAAQQHMASVNMNCPAWTSITIHTAKCDKCDTRNKNVLQRCQCNVQLCKICIMRLDLTDGHYVADVDALNWSKSSRKTKNRKGSSSQKPASSSSSLPQGQNRHVNAKRRSNQHRMAEEEKYNPQLPSMLAAPDPLGSPSNFPNVQTAGQARRTMDDPPIYQFEAMNPCTPPRQRGLTSGGTARLGSISPLAPIDTFGDIDADMELPALDFSYCIERVKYERAENARRIQNDKIAVFERECAIYWDTDPTLRGLRGERREDEAWDLFEAAKNLLAIERGITPSMS